MKTFGGKGSATKKKRNKKRKEQDRKEKNRKESTLQQQQHQQQMQTTTYPDPQINDSILRRRLNLSVLNKVYLDRQQDLNERDQT